MDVLGLIAIIFVGIILSAVSSAARKKQHDDDSEGKPPRRPMSELQRAFMMMSGMESEEDERKGETIISGFNAPRPPTGTANAQGFTGSEGCGVYEGMGDYEGSGNFEGLSDYGSVPRGSIASQAEGETGVYKYVVTESPKAARETDSDSAAFAFERLAEPSLERRAEMEHRLDESAEMADLAESSIIFAEADRPRPRLKLFEDKNDLVKAVIFSEVLARRSPFGRAAKR
jgi:hypothetical protein